MDTFFDLVGYFWLLGNMGIIPLILLASLKEGTDNVDKS